MGRFYQAGPNRGACWPECTLTPSFVLSAGNTSPIILCLPFFSLPCEKRAELMVQASPCEPHLTSLFRRSSWPHGYNSLTENWSARSQPLNHIPVVGEEVNCRCYLCRSYLFVSYTSSVSDEYVHNVCWQVHKTATKCMMYLCTYYGIRSGVSSLKEAA